MKVTFVFNKQVVKEIDLQLEELIALLGSDKVRIDGVGDSDKAYRVEGKLFGLGDNRRHLVVSLVEK